MNQRFYKSIVTLAVIHDRGPEVNDMPLEDVTRECLQGDFSGSWSCATEEITREEAAAFLCVQNTDPGFLINDWQEEPT